MNNYYISFRIADQTVEGKSYAERRSSLVENARLADGGFWDGTTSFIVAQSRMQTGEFAKSISQGLSRQYDMAIVIDPSDQSMAYFGAVSEADVLVTFFHVAIKV